MNTPNNRKATHPSIILKEDFLVPFAVCELAKKYKIKQFDIETILAGGPITPNIAKKLAGAFGSTPDFWLNLQKSYDNS